MEQPLSSGPAAVATHVDLGHRSQGRRRCLLGIFRWQAELILFSGNVFKKIALLCRYLNLGCIGEPTYYQVQRLYAAPAVETYLETMQTPLLAEKARQEQEIRLAGDGRNDSPGHSAQFCTFSFVDIETDAVHHLEVVDVRQAPSSVGMEKIGFIQGLDFLLSKVGVAEVITDQSPSITKVMKTMPSYQQIEHQNDIWHVAKNLEKRLIASCKPNSVLRQWITPIKNHFWWSSQVCEGQTLKMKEVWIRVLSHVCNIDEWHVGGYTSDKCSHARFSGVYSKRSHRWRPRREKQDTNYSYACDLQLMTFPKKQTDRWTQEKGPNGPCRSQKNMQYHCQAPMSTYQ